MQLRALDLNYMERLTLYNDLKQFVIEFENDTHVLKKVTI